MVHSILVGSLMGSRGLFARETGEWNCKFSSNFEIKNRQSWKSFPRKPAGFSVSSITKRYKYIFLYLRVSNSKLGDLDNRKHKKYFIFPHYIWRTNLHIWVSTVDTSKWHVDLWAAFQHTRIRIRRWAVSFVSENSRVWILSMKRILWVLLGSFQSFNSWNWSRLMPFSINRQVF